MKFFLIGVGLFVLTVFVLEMCFYALGAIRNPDRAKIRKKLKKLSAPAGSGELSDITHKRVLSAVPLLQSILLHVPGIRRLDRYVGQANLRYPLGVFVLSAAILALIGFLVGSQSIKNPILSVILAALMGGIPFFYIRSRRSRRMRKFERQLPDGLDLIGRALEVGNSFSSGMKMAVEEFDDPLSTEFEKTLDEINFGLSDPEALVNLANRVDCPDLSFFVISVQMYYEVGGNLTEIIKCISHIIRERFQLQGKVRVISSEARASAAVLIAIPFMVLFALLFVSPDYIKPLYEDPDGRVLAGIAGIMMTLGILIMRKMIDVKV